LNRKVKDALLLCAGSFMFALAISLFLEPFHISPGGVAGMAIIVSYLTDISTGAGMIVMNAPLVIITFIKMGKGVIIKTAVAVAISSVVVDLIARVPPPVDYPLLAAFAGGIFLGAGLGLVFRGGGTVGGTTIASKLVLHYKPHLRAGKTIFIMDAFVVVLTAVVFRDFALAVYAVIALFIASWIMDYILYGLDFATVTYIISDNYEEIGAAIQNRMGRRITYLDAAGGYRGTHKRVILCAVKPGELTSLRNIIEETDPQSILIVTQGHQIFGGGFLSS